MHTVTTGCHSPWATVLSPAADEAGPGTRCRNRRDYSPPPCSDAGVLDGHSNLDLFPPLA